MKKALPLILSLAVFLGCLTGCVNNNSGGTAGTENGYVQLEYFGPDSESLAELKTYTGCDIPDIFYDEEKKLLRIRYEYPKDGDEPIIKVISDSGEELAFYAYDSAIIQGKENEDTETQTNSVLIENMDPDFDYVVFQMDCTKDEQSYKYQIKATYESITKEQLTLINDESLALYKLYWENVAKENELYAQIYERDDAIAALLESGVPRAQTEAERKRLEAEKDEIREQIKAVQNEWQEISKELDKFK